MNLHNRRQVGIKRMQELLNTIDHHILAGLRREESCSYSPPGKKRGISAGVCPTMEISRERKREKNLVATSRKNVPESFRNGR